LEKQDFYPKLLRLQTKMSTSFEPNDVQTFDMLDDIRTKAILHANCRCRKLKMGQVPFSPKVVTHWNKIRAWKLVLRKIRGHKVDSKYLQQTLRTADITDIQLLSELEVVDNLKDAQVAYQHVKKEASIFRNTWLEEVAAARIQDGQTSVAQEIKSLMLRERQRRDARQIKYALSHRSRRSLCSIEVQQSGQWVELDTRLEIEAALLKELEGRFNQASDTPFCTEPLATLAGPFGNSEASKQILSGKFQSPQGTDFWATQLIPFLKQEITTSELRPLSMDEYIAGWKRVREKTSAGPSGITIPHFKAHGRSKYLSEIDTIMANLPYIYGFSPQRWKKGLDVMLEKKPGVRQVSSLRAILLYEADFNQNNKRLGREMLFRAEKYKAVVTKQFGSRKHLSAIDQSLKKALTFDIWRQLRQCGALCSNDAKSCYDRIVHNIASICMQRVGTPIKPIVSMFQTIQELTHHTRTVFGKSEIGYKPVSPVPIQGVGQGNGAGPQIWAVVSYPILNMLRARGLGASFRSAISGDTTNLVGYAFVDDTDLVTSEPQVSKIQVMGKMQNSLDAWEGGLRATGGAIVP
jgi:hypothetical protein